MLVLGRDVGEEILIGDHITIQVLEILGDKVKLGIKAPVDVDIQRRENRDPDAKADAARHRADLSDLRRRKQEERRRRY
jgi:carbon storage regulator